MSAAAYPVSMFGSLRTPFYYYDMALLERTLAVIRQELLRSGGEDWHLHYAVKANANPRILKTISAAGFGADCVSGGEIRMCIEAGFPAEKIVYAGVGKSDREIEEGLDAGIACFNVESLPELEVIDSIARRKGKVANVAFRINPDVGAHTHANITTGLAENKFGIAMEYMEKVIGEAVSMKGVEFCGLHFHIGSQILDMADFVALCNRINDLQDRLERRHIVVRSINVGGGLGIDYHHPDDAPLADFGQYFGTYRKHLNLRPGQQLHFELGRAVTGPCGSLVTRVLYVKKAAYKQFAIVDAGMNDLIRPALYHAFHHIDNISNTNGALETYDVVGPVCESSDVFVKSFDLPRCHRGDFLVIRSAGAYGESMASTYNGRPLPESAFSCDME